jgi:hypothetical protein
MNNIPKIKLGVVAVSRDCFPESLSVNRRKALIDAYESKYGKGDIYECPVCIVESEIHMMQALEDLKKAECNALCVYLGNFGPEISETMLAQRFDGPVMFCAAAEESGNRLIGDRGDAYCGMLNASYNLKLRNVNAYIPEVYLIKDQGTPAEKLTQLTKGADGRYSVDAGDQIAIKVKDETGTYALWPGSTYDYSRGVPGKSENGWSFDDEYEEYILYTCRSSEDFDFQGNEDYEIRVINNWGADYAVHLNFAVSL